MDGVSRAAVAVFGNVDKESFLQHIYPLRRPAVLKGIPLGPCTSKWTVDYLSTTGGSQEVKLHVASVPQMDFINKNFIYRTLPFDVFVKRAAETTHAEYFISQDEKYYLRSLGVDPRKDIADIRKQFPSLAEDINIPEFFENDQFFSSVFRISSPGLQLWTHYDICTDFWRRADGAWKLMETVVPNGKFTKQPSLESPSKAVQQVMDNLLIQVKGRKRVILFSPRAAPYLYLTGDKSEVLDVDTPDLEKYPQFVKAQRYECQLDPGDVLFIPALWFHNTVAKEFGVGVNVFWKQLPTDYYDKTDTYGNKDPVAASRAMQILDRALKTLEELPEEYRDFYARRMVLRIQSKSYSSHYK